MTGNESQSRPETGAIRRTCIGFSQAQGADFAFVGIGELNEAPPLLTDGFINQKELDALIAAGGAGEIVGWAYDEHGVQIDGLTNARVASVPLSQPPAFPTIGVARGGNKLRAIRAALAGRWINGLITDETTASALVAD